MRDEDRFAILLATRVGVMVLGLLATLLPILMGDSPLLVAALLCASVLALVMVMRVILRRRVGAPSGAGSTVFAHIRRTLEGIGVIIRRARRRGRVRRVEAAAAKAAGEGLAPLAPDALRVAADALYRLVVVAHNERDRRMLATLVDPDLLASWEPELAWMDNPAVVTRHLDVCDVSVECVGFTTGPSGEDPRAVVLLEAVLTAGPKQGAAHAEILRESEYWTLGLRDGRWTVLNTERDKAGRHHLRDPVGPVAAVAA